MASRPRRAKPPNHLIILAAVAAATDRPKRPPGQLLSEATVEAALKANSLKAPLAGLVDLVREEPRRLEASKNLDLAEPALKRLSK
jgi:hypothetical protein